MAESVEAKLDRILAMQEEFLAELRFLGLADAPSPPPPTKESPVVVQDAPPHPIDAKPLVVDAVPDAQIHPAVAVPDAETHPVAGPDAEIHPIATVDPTTRRLIDETRAVVRAEFEKLKVSMRERFAERFAKLAQVTAAPSSHRDVMPLHHHAYRRGITTPTDFTSIKSAPLQIHRDAEPSTSPTREVLAPIFTEKNVPTSLDTRCSRLSHQRSSNTSFGVEGTTSKESTLDHTLAAATPSVINVKPVTDEVVPALLVENKACDKRLSAPMEGAPANCLMKCPDSFTSPVAVYTIDKEPSTNPTSATATPTLFVEPNSYNSGAPFSCSSNCQGHADIVFDPGIATGDADDAKDHLPRTPLHGVKMVMATDLHAFPVSERQREERVAALRSKAVAFRDSPAAWKPEIEPIITKESVLAQEHAATPSSAAATELDITEPVLIPTCAGAAAVQAIALVPSYVNASAPAMCSVVCLDHNHNPIKVTTNALGTALKFYPEKLSYVALVLWKDVSFMSGHTSWVWKPPWPLYHQMDISQLVMELCPSAGLRGCYSGVSPDVAGFLAVAHVGVIGSLHSKCVLANAFYLSPADPMVDVDIDEERTTLCAHPKCMKVQLFDLGASSVGHLTKINEEMLEYKLLMAGNIVKLRPIPWPFFTMNSSRCWNMELLWHWKPPWLVDGLFCMGLISYA